MWTPLAASALTALVAAALGLPLAILRSSTSSFSTLAADSLLGGTAILVSTIALWTWLGLPATLVVVAIGAAVVAATVRHRGLTKLAPWPGVPQITTVVIVAVLVVGLVLRLRSVEFLPWAGDMGDYTNAANQLIASGRLDVGFPPGFVAYMALPALLFGPVGTTASVPFLGVLLLVAMLRLMGQLRLPMLARAAGIALAAFSPVAIWYSSFPVSEALQAPLTILLISAVIGTLADKGDGTSSLGDLLTIAVSSLALGFNRGTALLLLLPLLLLLVSCLHPAWRVFGRRAAHSTAAALIGFGVGFLYGVSEIPAYFVDRQISTILPSRLAEFLADLGLLRVSPQLIAALVAVPLLLLAAGELFRRWPVDTASEARHRLWPLPVTIGLAVAIVMALAMEGEGEILDQLDRMGLALLVGGLLALAIPTGLRRWRGPFLVLGGSTVAVMLLLQLTRFEESRNHAFFLYWDRYLFSEVLPLLIVLSSITFGVLLEAVDRRTSDQQLGTRVLGDRNALARGGARLSIVGAVVAILVVHSAGTRLVVQETAFANTVGLFDGIVELMPDPSVPIVWTAPGSGPEGVGFFPNSWHAMGWPLVRTYERDVVNLDQEGGAFALDPVVEAQELSEVLSCSAEPTVHVVEFSRSGASDLDTRLAGQQLSIENLGVVDAQIPQLSQRPSPEWREVQLTAVVWRVELQSGTESKCGTA